MSVLFDKGEPERKKTKKSRKKQAGKFESTKSQLFSSSAKNLGTVAGTYQCDSCDAKYFDIDSEKDGYWRLHCAFCGNYQWEVALSDIEQPEHDSFVMPEGIHAGKSLTEISKEPKGVDYIKFTAKKSKKLIEREACKTWLDAQGHTK